MLSPGLRRKVPPPLLQTLPKMEGGAGGGPSGAGGRVLRTHPLNDSSPLLPAPPLAPASEDSSRSAPSGEEREGCGLGEAAPSRLPRSSAWPDVAAAAPESRSAPPPVLRPAAPHCRSCQPGPCLDDVAAAAAAVAVRLGAAAARLRAGPEPPGGAGARQSGVLRRMTAEPSERAKIVQIALQQVFQAGFQKPSPGTIEKAAAKVKAFITVDLPLYHNLEMKHLPGADPELVLLNYKYEELQRIPLSDMTRDEINQLLRDLGFYQKEKPDSPVPEEFQHAPAQPSPGSKEAKRDQEAETKGAAGSEL